LEGTNRLTRNHVHGRRIGGFSKPFSKKTIFFKKGIIFRWLKFQITLACWLLSSAAFSWLGAAPVAASPLI
jgi:hypothetical protein